MGIDNQGGLTDTARQQRAEIESETLASQEIADAIDLLQQTWFDEEVGENKVFARIAEYLLPAGHALRPEGIDAYLTLDESDQQKTVLEAVQVIINNDNLIRKTLQILMLKASNGGETYTYPEVDTLLGKFAKGKDTNYTLARVVEIVNEEGVNILDPTLADDVKKEYLERREEVRERLAKKGAVSERDIDVALTKENVVGTKYISNHVDKTKKPTYMWAREPLAFGMIRDSLNGVLDTMMGQVAVDQGYIDFAPDTPGAVENNKKGGILGSLVLSGDLTPQQAYYLRKAIFDKMRIGRQMTAQTIRPAARNRMITSLWILDTYGLGDLQLNERGQGCVYTPRLSFSFPQDMDKLTEGIKLHAKRFFALDGSIANEREQEVGIRSLMDDGAETERASGLAGLFGGKKTDLLTALEELDMELPVEDMKSNTIEGGVRNLPGASITAGRQLNMSTTAGSYDKDMEGQGAATVGKLVFAAGRAEELKVEYIDMKEKSGETFWKFFKNQSALTMSGNERNPEQSLEVYLETASGLDEVAKEEVRESLSVVRRDITGLITLSKRSRDRIKGFLPSSRDKKNNIPLKQQINEIEQFVKGVDALNAVLISHKELLDKRIKELDSAGDTELSNLLKAIRAYYGKLLADKGSSLSMTKKTAQMAEKALPLKRKNIRRREARIRKSKEARKAGPSAEAQAALDKEVRQRFETIMTTLGEQSKSVIQLSQTVPERAPAEIRALLVQAMPNVEESVIQTYVAENLAEYIKGKEEEFFKLEDVIRKALFGLNSVETQTASEMNIVLDRQGAVIEAVQAVLSNYNK